MPSPTLVLSFHGSSSGKHNKLKTFPALANVTDEPPELQEPRGFLVGPGSDSNHLYVVNAYKKASLIYRYTSTNSGTYTGGEPFASDGLSHPFDAVFGPDGNLYVSNQDSNQITYYQGPGGQSPGALIGTFGTKAQPQFTTLRGLAWVGSALYAADEDAGALGFNSDGTSNNVKIAVKDPVHLFYDGARYLYIGSGSGNSVWVWDTTQQINPNPVQILGSNQTPAIDATAGMALPGDGNLYVASRKGNVILQYPIDVTQNPPKVSNGQVLSPGLKDNPEFVGSLSLGVYG
jgi:hypothetical protein